MSSYNKSCKLKSNNNFYDCEIIKKTLKNKSYYQLTYRK